MTQRSLFSSFMLTAMLGFVLSIAQPAHAQEAKDIPAASREDAAAASDAANATSEPGEPAETPAAADAEAAPELSADEAIRAADAIAAYDPALVNGIAKPWQVYYQNPASPVMEHLEWLHDYVMWFIVIITIVVTALLAYVCIKFRAKKHPKPHRFAHNTMVEIAWTVLPIVILIAIGIPSVRAHFQYTNNENIINNPDLTLKVTGNQWYWSYEYPDSGIKFDSNMVQEADLKEGEPRLLMVDNPVIVPVNKVVRVQITAADVMHNWAMPAFGIKQDAIPGKLNETWFKATQTGIYFGQCSELCGKFHGFMPIMVKVVSEEEYATWVAGAKEKFADAGTLQFALNQ